MIKDQLIEQLKELTKQKHLEIVLRGNTAIESALSIVPKEKKLLIPEEGGWIHYKKGPEKMGLMFEEVKCEDAKIDLRDLKHKLETKEFFAFLYETPGGYFAEEPVEDIYNLCEKHDCLVILDVSGSIGTKFCNSKFSDILIGSFGRWKPINAEVGGFISTNNKTLWEQIKIPEKLDDLESLQKIQDKLDNIQERISTLQDVRNKVIFDLKDYDIVHKEDFGFVVIVKYSKDEEKEKIVMYCEKNKLPFTECPRYIRINQKAISIEIKKL